MLRRRVAAFAFVVGVAIAGAANGCSSDEYVVGGECVVPLVQCEQKCVDLSNDPDNCGACGNMCTPGVACVGGQCGGTLDGSPDAHGDSATPDGRAPMLDGQAPDGSSDGSTTDGGNKD